jgi:hypothetical protein
VNLDSLRSTSDKHGRFEMFFVAMPHTVYQIGVRLDAGGSIHQSDNGIMLASQPVENARVELDCPDELAVRGGRRK